MLRKLSLFAFLAALPLLAQTPQQPDCFLSLNVPTGTTPPFNIGPFDNRTAGCTTWQIVYNSVTYSALSIVVQTAPNAAGGVPGSWSTFTAVSGSNPNTATTEAVSTFGGTTSYFPWLRVQLTSATGAGTISGKLYGWRIPPAGVVVVTPSGTQDVNLIQVAGAAISEGQKTMAASLPVALASNQSTINIAGTGTAGTANAGVATIQGIAGMTPVQTQGSAAAGAAPANPLAIAGLGSGATGGLLSIPTNCDTSVAVAVTGGNTTQLVALTSGRKVRVCSFSIALSLAGTIQFISGTGSNCGTGPSNLSGAMAIGTAGSVNFFGSNALLSTVTSEALCLAAVTGNAAGVLSYAVY